MSYPRAFVLESVPSIDHLTHPDIFAEVLGIAVAYADDGVYERIALLRAYRLGPRHRDGIYGAISAVTGRGWMIGFDAAGYAPGGEGPSGSIPSFPVAGIESHLSQHDTLWQAIRYLDRVPEPVWNDDCAYPVDAARAAGFGGACSRVGAATLRRYITDYLSRRRRPLIVLLHAPQVPIVEMALLTGYDDDGAAVFGHYPYSPAVQKSAGGGSYVRLQAWQPRVLAAIGIAEERAYEWRHSPGYVAMDAALRHAASSSDDGRHLGLAAYDAWERALLDDASIAGADEGAIERRLRHHSAVAGFIACQKAFCVLPEVEAPSMGVIGGLARRGAAGPGIIHGLMWDVWQAVGGYWRGLKPGDGDGLLWRGTDEAARFRDPAVRRRAAAVVRRAREVDAQALADLRAAKAEWDTCRGHGHDYPCPCWDRPCARV